MARLSGKIAVVTGAGGGIGAAIAQRFAVEGAHVWVTDINGETAEETVRNIKAAGGAATAMSVDVSKGQDVTALLRNIENAHGYIDIVVNNAGILVRGEVRQLSDAEWTKLREVNLDAILRISRDALPLLRKSKAPTIINISSIMAHRGLRPLAAYTATKGAITALTKGLAVEYAQFNVRVNSIAPGYVETGITDRLLKLPPVKQALIDKTPMGRLGRPEDLAGAAVFFASDDSLYCTGSELAVDGGMGAGL
ncbi:glucose 1-dehydrogenase [Hyphomicrobium sp.]|uniref:SDR family NAD(P)-dependent oxidoreductase n=1 Tax=Hyphomicrobium sp. TaxID=82 RepID=UPI000FC1621B|nr:glucose 1-dehydrogenase [Hyphomicrobium sp.]RUO99129.1 MAG: glucose 1-dehydrogenase [Hyphomicrobium sp.]